MDMVSRSISLRLTRIAIDPRKPVPIEDRRNYSSSTNAVQAVQIDPVVPRVGTRGLIARSKFHVQGSKLPNTDQLFYERSGMP
jgi:hypothetical protein